MKAIRYPIAFKSLKAQVRRTITIWKVIQKGSHEPILKSNTKKEAKRLRATTLAIAKLEVR